MDTLTYLAERFGLDLRTAKSPVEIPNVTREDLAALFAELGFKRGAEIGVERGLYSETICKANPGVQHYAVDYWKRIHRYRDHVDGEKLQRFYVEASERLEPYGVTVIRELSMNAVTRFDDGSLDYVYVDGAHDFQSVTNDIAEWSRKVRPGGIISGHDYLFARLPSLMHVPLVVDPWVRAYSLEPLFIMGAREKAAGVKRDDGRSWFYVQPAPRERKPGEKIKQ